MNMSADYLQPVIDDDDDDDEIPTLENLDDDDDDEIPTLENLDDDDDETTPHNDNNETDANANAIMNDLPPVPVTILTGFLGSGKTTLVKHILTSPKHKKRIAVIENEFGGGDETNEQLAKRMGLNINDTSTLSVETMIAKDGTTDANNLSSLSDLIELPNGCVCCTVKDSLVETLELLLAKRTDLDYVIIEASGMADPGPVASIFWLDEALESRIRLDGIVTCVDAKNIGYQLEMTGSGSGSGSGSGGSSSEGHSMPEDGGGDEAARQIAFADRIIVNKVDLLLTPENNENTTTTTTIDTVMQQIKSINPTAPIKTTTYSTIEDIDWILDANCFDAERAKDVESAFQQSMDMDNNTIGVVQKFATAMNGMTCNHPSCNVDHTLNDAFCGMCNEPPPPLSFGTATTTTTPQHQHQHTSAVGTIALFGRGSVNLHKINTWLASILWPDQDESDKVCSARLKEDLAMLRNNSEGDNNGNEEARQSSNKSNSNERGKQNIYRVKGILSVGHAIDDMGKVIPNDWVDDDDDDDDGLCDGPSAGMINANDGLDQRRFIVQAVNDLWDVLPASQNLCWDVNETRCCKIVVIGRWLDEAKLQEGFQDCFVTS